MIFTSYTYIAFLVAAFLVHWALPRGMRNGFLVAMSYVFYCSWKWQYGFLLLGVSLFTWTYGGFLARRREEPRWLAVGVAVELAPLLFYKYMGFLVTNVDAVLGAAGASPIFRWPDIALPLGISFFTFQGIAYLVDVATGAEPFERVLDFVLYKGFWPQLVAGPIVRPEEIREQIENERRIDYADVAAGTKRILTGLFKKAVLADTIAPYVDSVFSPHASPSFVDACVATLGFGMQIYFDFGGYSDVAIGSAQLFGFRFPENFDWPYVSRSFTEFWGRWHMTLSRWIRDYVFTPMMFAYRDRPATAGLWLLVAMTLCGLWHGARWTFIAWGAVHGLLLIANHTFLKGLFAGLEVGRPARERARGLIAWLIVFGATMAAWLLFRAQSFDQVGSFVRAALTLRGGLRPMVLRENAVLLIGTFFFGLLAAQIAAPRVRRLRRRLPAEHWAWRPLSGAYYAMLILCTVVFEAGSRAFVYFQF